MIPMTIVEFLVFRMSYSFFLTLVVPGTAYVVYAALMDSSPGQATLGKRAMDLKVTDTDYRPVNFGQAFGRETAKIVLPITVIGALGFLGAAFGRRKQCLHDLIAGTLVVRTAR